MFIAFDGIDGSGKTTIYKEISNLLEQHGNEVKLFDMGNLGFLDNVIKKIKSGEYVCNAEIRECIYYFEGMLFSERIAKKYINNKTKHILVDRYILSYMAYGPTNGMNLKQINSLCETMVWPDLYFFIDTNPNIALERIAKYRKIHKPEVGFKNSLKNNEEENQLKFLNHQSVVYKNFETAIKKSKKQVHIIDNNDDLSISIIKIMKILNQKIHNI